MHLLEWALKHKITPAALRDLCHTCVYTQPVVGDGESESTVQRDVRLEAAALGKYLFRNNKGAGTHEESGNFIRWGLCNDTKVLGSSVRSADLVGFEPIIITPEWIGCKVARFLSVECKPEGWSWSGTQHEMAQLKWATLINAEGGRAIITTKTGVL